MLQQTVFGGQGSKIYFIHGLASDAQSWIANVPAVTEYMHAIGIDLPGHGLSSTVPVPDTLQQLADRVIESIDSSAPCVLVGHSAGGAVAMLCATRIPVRGLSLIAPAGLGEGVNMSFPHQLLAAKSEDEAHTTLQSMFVNKRLVSKLAAKRLYAVLQSDSARYRWRLFSDLLYEAGDVIDAALDELSRINVPMQISWGRNDLINPWCEADQRRVRAQWHIFDDCGHLPHIEHLSRYNSGLVKFIVDGS